MYCLPFLFQTGYKRSLDEWRQSRPTSEDDSLKSFNIAGGNWRVKKAKACGLGSQHCLGCQDDINSLRRQVQKWSKSKKQAV